MCHIILILVQFSYVHIKAALTITRTAHLARIKTLSIHESINSLLARKELVLKILTLLIIPVRCDTFISLMALCALCPVHGWIPWDSDQDSWALYKLSLGSGLLHSLGFLDKLQIYVV